MAAPISLPLRAPIFQPLHSSVLVRPGVVVGMMTFVGAVLRVYHLGYKSLWVDEADLYWISQSRLDQVVIENTAGNRAPPLFPILLNVVINVARSEEALRLIACLAGIASIPAFYFLARRFLSRPIAYLSTFLFAVAPTQIQYSQQVREYSVTVLLACVILGFFFLFRSSEQPKYLASMTICSALGIFAQYGIAFLVLGLNVAFGLELVVSRSKVKLLPAWILSQLSILLAVAFIYSVSLRYQFVSGGFASDGFLANGYWHGQSLQSLLQFGVNSTGDLLNFAFPVPIASLGLMLLGALLLLRRSQGTVTVLPLVLPWGLTFLAGVLQAYPYLGTRHDIFLTPAMYVLAGYGIEFLWLLQRGRWLVYLLAPALALFALFATGQYLESRAPENIRPVVGYLVQELQPGDRVYVFYGSKPAFNYYYRVRYRASGATIVYGEKRVRREGYVNDMKRLLTPPGRFWLIFSHCADRPECFQIPEYAAQVRPVQKVMSDVGAFLYLAQ